MNENAHLFVCCRIPLENISLENISLELSSFQVKGCKLRLSLAAFEQGIDLYRATSTVIWGFGLPVSSKGSPNFIAFHVKPRTYLKTRIFAG